jgi:hypothetical protein
MQNKIIEPISVDYSSVLQDVQLSVEYLKPERLVVFLKQSQYGDPLYYQ